MGFALLATPPAPAEPAAEISAYLAGHRSEIFAAALLIGAGAALFLWFLAAVAVSLAPGAGMVPVAAGVLAGWAGTIIVIAGLAVLAGLALHPTPGGLEGVVGFDVYNALVTIAGCLFLASVLCLVVAGTRSGRLAPSLRRIGIAVAILQVATLPGLFVEAGPLAPGGTVALVAFWSLTAWFVALAVRMLRSGSGGRAALVP